MTYAIVYDPTSSQYGVIETDTNGGASTLSAGLETLEAAVQQAALVLGAPISIEITMHTGAA